MLNTSNQTSIKLKTPLASIQWLIYLGIFFAITCLYILGAFYWHYSDDIFPKSLSIGQLLRLSLLSIGSQLSFILIPSFFFSGALLYRSVRQNSINPLTAIKRDLLVIVPIGIALWIYGAFYQSHVKAKFHAMIFEVQQLEPGEKLVQDPYTFELIGTPNLNGLCNKIDTLDLQIEIVEQKFVDQLASFIPPAEMNEILEDLDFGSIEVERSDIRNSSRKWDSIERNAKMIANYSRGMIHYIETLKTLKRRYQDEIRLIHFTPIYALLFLLFGMLLGYLIPLHKMALTAILIAIAFTGYYSSSLLEISFDANYSNRSWFVLCKIGVLLLLNICLLIVARKFYRQSVNT